MIMKISNGVKDYQELVAKIEKLKKSGGVDLSMEEDLSLAVMNLISLEEHFFFTGERTKKDEYFGFLSDVREHRKALMKKLLPEHEGETWCAAKHLLATTMRLVEVGTKLRADGKQEEAKDVFDRAYNLYSMFWGLRLRLIDTKELKTVAAADQPWTLQDIVSKLVDCCDERT